MTIDEAIRQLKATVGREDTIDWQTAEFFFLGGIIFTNNYARSGGIVLSALERLSDEALARSATLAHELDRRDAAQN